MSCCLLPNVETLRRIKLPDLNSFKLLPSNELLFTEPLSSLCERRENGKEIEIETMHEHCRNINEKNTCSIVLNQSYSYGSSFKSSKHRKDFHSERVNVDEVDFQLPIV